MGYKKIPTKDLTRLEWLELRREGIGGSDASVVMGENPYRSILQLWEEKTGRKEITDEGNEYTYWGTLMEDVIRHEFMKRTGLKVRQKHFMIFHADLPYLFADVVGLGTERNVSLKPRRPVSTGRGSGRTAESRRSISYRYSITLQFAD